MHTISEIYDELIILKSSLTPSKIRSGITYLGNTGFCAANDDGSCVVGELGNSCLSGTTCNPGLYCGDDSYQCAFDCNNVCTTGGVGSSCTNSNQCATGHCDTVMYGTCTDGGLNSYCGDDTGCQPAFFCDIYNTYQCTPRPCTTNQECIDAGTGIYCGINGSGEGSCTDGSINDPCNSNTQCISSLACSLSVNKCLVANGDTCASNAQCSSGYCNSLADECTTGMSPAGCGGDSECSTYSCVSNQCSDELPPLTSGLVGYWPFNETSGTSAADLSGNNNTATLNGGVTVNLAEKVGKAVSLDGIDGYVAANDSASLDIENQVSLGAWVKLDTLNGPGSYPNIIGKSADYAGYFLYSQGDGGYIEFSINNACGVNFQPPTGEWFYLFATYNGSVSKIYKNGILQSSISCSQIIGLNDNPLIIGQHYNGTGDYGFLDGSVDEMAIWNRALSPAEITNLYNGGAGMSIITP